MKTPDNILQELKFLGSSLSKMPRQKTYEAPASYFDNLASKILARIKENKENTLSPTLENISDATIFSTPVGYFDGLEEKIMAGIRQHADYQNAKEEINAISPLLAGIPKTTTYQTPVGYFDSIAENVNRELNIGSATNVISITGRKWFRLAVAAVLIGFFAISGIFYLNQNNKVDVSKNPDRWISKTIKKQSTQDIEAFIYSVDPGFSTHDIVITNPVKTEYVKTLLQDISDAELQHFLDETTFDHDEEAILLN